MSSPSAVSFFRDAETYNGIPDQAALARRIARWERWCHERMTGQVPCAARWPFYYAPGYANDRISFRFYVPAPPAPNRILRVWWTEVNDASRGYLGFRSVRTGTTQWINAAAPYYKTRTGTITVDAPDVIEVLEHDDGTGVGRYYPVAAGAWWEPLSSALVPGATFAPWSAISQTYLAAGRPDSTYVLRWLARMANHITSARQRHVLSYAQAALGAGQGPILLLPAKAPSVKVWVYMKATAAITQQVAITAIEDGVTNLGFGSAAVLGDGVWRWVSFTLPTALAADRVGRLTVTRDASAAYATAIVEEDPWTAAALGLPAKAGGGLEDVPAAFVDLEDQSILGGGQILADANSAGARGRGRKALVENMIFLAANKVRTLCAWAMFDSSVYGNAGGVHPANANPLNWQTQDVIRFRATPDGWTKQLRVSAGVRLKDGLSSTGQGIATGQGDSDNGVVGPLLLANRIPASTKPAWYTEEAPAVASGAAFTFRRILTSPPAQNASIEALADGFVVEELPKGTPTTTW